MVERPELDGFWIHLDADVLDPELMLPSIRPTIYDPDRDPDLTAGRRLADLLVEALAPVRLP